MRRHVPVLVLALVGLVVVACARNGVGSRDYYVEVQDTVVDPYGNAQPALCADWVRFTGDIDERCAARPMTRSYEETVVLDCTYQDSAGAYRYYTDYFLFVEGYIHDPSCGGYQYLSTPDAGTDVHAASTLPRDAEGRVILDRSITLGTRTPSIGELRDALDRRPQGVDPRGI